MRIKGILSQPGAYAVTFAMMFFANSLAAATIGAGLASIDGAATVTNTTVLFFSNTAVPNVYDVNTGSGSFAGITTPDSIMNLTGGPITGNISVVDFITFTTALGLINFDLTHIDPGTGTAAACLSNTVGNVCTPAGSPFTISQITPTTVGLALSVEGWAYTGTSATGETGLQGLFTGQQVPGTITEVINELGITGSFTNSYSASFSTTTSSTPEPGTLGTFLIGTGLVGLGLFRRRKSVSTLTRVGDL